MTAPLDELKQLHEHLEAVIAKLEAPQPDEAEPEIDYSTWVGRLVLVRSSINLGYEDRPRVLTAFNPKSTSPFLTHGKFWAGAKLYQGPTRPNWIEWRGGSCPVSDGTPVLVQYRKGGMYLTTTPESLDWAHPTSPTATSKHHDIMRYTVIEP